MQRTRQLLRGALMSLIQEKGFEALTVQEIIDRANVGRATFYAHFNSKDDLLVNGLEDLRASLKERQRRARTGAAKSDERTFAFSLELFAHANDHRDVYRSMVGKRSGAVVQRLIHEMLVDLVREDLRSAGSGSASSAPTEAVVQFVAGGLFGLLLWWADGRMRLSVEEVNALFRRLALPATEAVLR